MDFDGTLAHIVDVPSEARPAAGTQEVLVSLAKEFALLAIVSGRATHELVSLLGAEIEIWGVHGAERAIHGRVEVASEVEPWITPLANARSEAEEALKDVVFDGCLVEDKRVALALHHRMATQPGAAEALEVLADLIAVRHGLRRTDAKMAFELRPPVDVSKGSVVLRRSRELDLGAVAFVGDDVVDLAAFDALDELEREGRRVVRVAVDSEEAPEELLSRADEVVAGVDGAVRWISDLARGAAGA